MQRINLYQGALYVISESLLSLFRLVGVAILALILVSAALYVNLILEKTELTKQVDSRNKVTRTYKNESTEITIPKEDIRLIRKIKELKNQRQRKKAITELIQDQRSILNPGFYQTLFDLYENDTKNIWLKEINVSFPGPRVKLIGWLKHPQDLPIYIENLRYSSTFSNIEYDVFDIDVDPDNPDYLRFILATSHEQLQKNAPDQIEQIFRAVQ